MIFDVLLNDSDDTNTAPESPLQPQSSSKASFCLFFCYGMVVAVLANLEPFPSFYSILKYLILSNLPVTLPFLSTFSRRPQPVPAWVA
jgi:hypothetical protein